MPTFKHAHSPSLPYADTIGSPINNRKGWLIWGCAGLFYLYEMILRASPSVMANELMHDFGVASTSLGVLSSFYYYAYVILQIPCGVIVDKLGTRKVITTSTLLCVLGSLLFAYSDSLYLAQMGRFLIGAGSACAFLSCLKIGSDWFLPAQFALIAGLTNMMGTLGGIMSGPPFALLMNHFGWRQATIFAALLGLGLAILCWFIIKERPKQKESSEIPLFRGLFAVARLPQNWIIGIVGGLMYVPISAFCELWAVPFLMEKYAVSNHTAATASIMVYLGIAFGSPWAAKLSDYWESRTRVIALSAFLTAFFFLAALTVNSIPFEGMLVILFLAGVVNSGQILCFAAIKERMPNTMSGTAIGFTNALVMMSGIVFQPVLGILLDMGWQGDLHDNGARLYNSDAYHMAILAIPFCLGLSWVMIILVRDTFKKVYVD